MIALACGVLGFLAGLFVSGWHWRARIEAEAKAHPEAIESLRHLLRWPA